MDFLHLASRLDMDEADFMELVALFVHVSLSDLEKIQKGVAANDPGEAAAAAHSIKGAAANLGFESLAALAKTMEDQAKSGNLENFNRHMADLEGQVKGMAVNLA